MQPTISPEQKPNQHILLKIVVSVAVLAVIAGALFFIIRSVHQVGLENDVKTELIKQNKLIQASAKNGVYAPTLPEGVMTTDKIIINATISASGTTYCVDATNKQDTQVVFHMDKDTPADAPVKGSCSDGATVAPLVPANVAVGSIGAGAISLTWNQAPYASSYTAQCAGDKNFITGLKIQTTNDTVVTMNNLSGGMQYYCRVAAGNSVGKSDWSVAVDALTNPVSVVPTGLKITTVSSSQLHYEFKAVPGAQAYVVAYSEDDSFVKGVTSFTTSGTSGDIKGLKTYTAYYFHVKAVTTGFDATHAAFSGEELGRTAK